MKARPFLCLLLACILAFACGSVCTGEAGKTTSAQSFSFFTPEINELIDQNYEQIRKDGWAELRIPASLHGITEDIFSPNAVDAAHKLIDAGYEAYCIGGAVRDLVMGTPTMDFDITTTASNEEFARILGDVTFHTIPSGLSFGFAHYPDEVIDVASCVNIPKAYLGLPGIPDFDPESLYSDNFVADSFERDLTFNAIYYDFKTGDLVDYHGGLHDIREGIVDTMLDSVVALGHDPRIAIRGIRFVSRYGFRFSDRMDVAMRKNGAEYVAANSPEMNRENIAKYYDAGYARRCLDTLEEYGLFCAVYPPVAELYDTEAYRQYICSATDWMDERYAAGMLVRGETATAIFLWPAVAGAEDLAAAARGLFEAQRKTIEIPGDQENLFLDMYAMQAELTKDQSRESAQENLQRTHFQDALELLMIRSRMETGLEDAVNFWTELVTETGK